MSDWAAQRKSAWDRLRRRKIPIHIVVTGSCALSLTWGSRESLAGRFERITLSHWGAGALAAVFGIEPLAAVDQFVRQGSCPGAVGWRDDFRRWATYVRDGMVEPAIGRDILVLGPIRKQAGSVRSSLSQRHRPRKLSLSRNSSDSKALQSQHGGGIRVSSPCAIVTTKQEQSPNLPVFYLCLGGDFLSKVRESEVNREK